MNALAQVFYEHDLISLLILVLVVAVIIIVLRKL